MPSPVSLKCDYRKKDNKFNKFIKNSNFLRHLIIIGNYENNLNINQSSIYLLTLTIIDNNLFHKKGNYYPNLIHLKLINNDLTWKSNILNKKQKLLESLILIKNPIFSLAFLKNLECKNLIEFEISFTEINSIFSNAFSQLNQLRLLRITNSRIKNIEKSTFLHLINLERIYLNNTKIPEYFFPSLSNQLKFAKIISGDYVNLCCFIWIKISFSTKCFPKNPSIITCLYLIKSKLQQIVFWFVGLIGSTTNLISLIMLLLLSKNDSQNFRWLMNLSNLFMCLYSLTLVLANSYYYGIYIENQQNWKSSFICRSLGMMLNFSIILSPVSLLLMTLEKYSERKIEGKKSTLKSYHKIWKIFVIFLCLMISIFPFAFIKKVYYS